MEPRKRVNRGPPGWDDRKAITSRRYRQGGGDRGGVVPRRGFPRVIERGMAESGAVGTEETSRGRASVWRPARLGRRVPKASGGVGGRHRTQSAGKPRTGGRRSTGSAGSSRRFPHTAEDAKRMRDGSASPAPASSWGAGCVNGARAVRVPRRHRCLWVQVPPGEFLVHPGSEGCRAGREPATLKPSDQGPLGADANR